MVENIQVNPLPIAEWDQSLSHVIDDMNGHPLNVHALLANHPALLNAWWNFRNYSVFGGDLGKRRAELVILRVAVHMRAWYEWGSHVDRSLACGLTLEEIERVRKGSEVPGWASEETLLLQAVDELIISHGLSETMHIQLREYYSARQVMDIIAIHGMYVILGCMINTWGLELDSYVAERLPPTVTQTEFDQHFPRCQNNRDTKI